MKVNFTCLVTCGISRLLQKVVWERAHPQNNLGLCLWTKTASSPNFPEEAGCAMYAVYGIMGWSRTVWGMGIEKHRIPGGQHRRQWRKLNGATGSRRLFLSDGERTGLPQNPAKAQGLPSPKSSCSPPLGPTFLPGGSVFSSAVWIKPHVYIFPLCVSYILTFNTNMEESMKRTLHLL